MNKENKKLLNELKAENESLREEIADLKQQIADHVCEKEVVEVPVEVPVEVLIPCNHEEEIEVLKAQVASIQTEKEELVKQHEEQLTSLQAEIEQLKKILATN